MAGVGLPLTGVVDSRLRAVRVVGFAGGSAHPLSRRQFSVHRANSKEVSPPPSGRRFDLTSCDADVVQRAVIEVVKRVHGALRHPYFSGSSNDARGDEGPEHVSVSGA